MWVWEWRSEHLLSKALFHYGENLASMRLVFIGLRHYRAGGEKRWMRILLF